MIIRAVLIDGIAYDARWSSWCASDSDAQSRCGGVVAELWPSCGENNACKNGAAIVLS